MKVFWPFLAVAAVALVEFFVARAWTAAYFRFGLPLLRMRLPGVRLEPTTEGRLMAVADRNASLIVYERLSESEIAFREKGRASVTFRYLPVLHGLVRYSPEEGATYVIGWMNYWALAAVGLYTYIFLSAPRYRRPWDLLAMFTFIFGVMVAIGIWRYRMVGKALRNGETAPQSSPAQ